MSAHEERMLESRKDGNSRIVGNRDDNANQDAGKQAQHCVSPVRRYLRRKREAKARADLIFSSVQMQRSLPKTNKPSLGL
jgi:hypothetical protein